MRCKWRWWKPRKMQLKVSDVMYFFREWDCFIFCFPFFALGSIAFFSKSLNFWLVKIQRLNWADNVHKRKTNLFLFLSTFWYSKFFFDVPFVLASEMRNQTAMRFFCRFVNKFVLPSCCITLPFCTVDVVLFALLQLLSLETA